MDTKEFVRIWARISLLTQLGLSVVTPPILLTLLALFLQRRFGVGDWVLLVAILTGVFSGVTSVFSFVRRENAREVKRLTKAGTESAPDGINDEKETDDR